MNGGSKRHDHSNKIMSLLLFEDVVIKKIYTKVWPNDKKIKLISFSIREISTTVQ
jgi:hypothetical protein